MKGTSAVWNEGAQKFCALQGDVMFVQSLWDSKNRESNSVVWNEGAQNFVRCKLM